MVFASIQTADLVARCLAPLGALDGAACDRVAAYVGELVRYNERTNIYAQSSYECHALGSTVLCGSITSRKYFCFMIHL